MLPDFRININNGISKTIFILKSGNTATSFPDMFATTPTPVQLTRPTPPTLLICLCHFYIIQLSSYQEVLFDFPRLNIWELVVNKYPVYHIFYGLKSVKLTANMDLLASLSKSSLHITKNRYLPIREGLSFCKFRCYFWEFFAGFIKILMYISILKNTLE